MPMFSFVDGLLANAGVPLFTINLFWQILLLIPICAIEIFIYRQRLSINLCQSCKISVLVNLLSTALGVMIVMGLGLLGAGLADSDSPPLNIDELMVFLLLRVMGLLGMGFLSIQVESWGGLRLIKGIERKVVQRSFLTANTASYLFLAVVMLSAQMVDFSTSRQAIATIEQQLAEYDKQCPIIVNNEACDQVFYPRETAYLRLSRLYRDHDQLTRFVEIRTGQLADLYKETKATCELGSQRVVCKEFTDAN